jgi:hypothetical protein
MSEIPEKMEDKRYPDIPADHIQLAQDDTTQPDIQQQARINPGISNMKCCKNRR